MSGRTLYFSSFSGIIPEVKSPTHTPKKGNFRKWLNAYPWSKSCQKLYLYACCMKTCNIDSCNPLYKFTWKWSFLDYWIHFSTAVYCYILDLIHIPCFYFSNLTLYYILMVLVQSDSCKRTMQSWKGISSWAPAQVKRHIKYQWETKFQIFSLK